MAGTEEAVPVWFRVPKVKKNLNVTPKEHDLGMRFITRRDDGDFWYVQIRVSVDGERRTLPGKSFYDKNYGGREAAKQEAIAYRDELAWPFFEEVGYDPTYRERAAASYRKWRDRPKKYHKRKEAKAGPLANLVYIHLRKRNGKYTRCVIDVQVKVHKREYHSTAYSYAFDKYGGKTETLKIAKRDRNKLARLIHQKTAELNSMPPLSYEETRRIIKGIRINQTPPKIKKDPDKYIRRAKLEDFWIVEMRKEIWSQYYRTPNQRFYDEAYGGRQKARMAALKYASTLESAILAEFDSLRKQNNRNLDEIKARFDQVVEAVGKQLL